MLSSNRASSRLRNRFFPILIAVLSIAFTSCNKGNDLEVVVWGKTNTYDPFLWKKHVPDTLKQTLCFDFNDDARNYLSEPLRLGVFKKDAAGHLRPVQTDEMELYVNGQPAEGNIISVNASESEAEVGIVMNSNAENKLHYWYIKPIGNAGLDRIKDKDAYGADEAVMEIRVRKRHVMNPLAEEMMWFGIIVLGALVLWFLVLKHIFFPPFRVTRLLLTGPEPYMSQLKIKGYRLCVLDAHPKKQGWFNKVFAGEIKYETNALWTAPVVFEPRDKKSIRVRPDKQTYTTDARLMKTNTDYVLVNETTKAKTTIRIS